MAHLQYMPGDPRLVDQLVCELKSKGIFDQFRKECIADVDTRPAYQNLRQRVETSVSTFLSRQVWKPDLNKNQLREKLRKHILDGNYLEQGVERIVDQVVNPKVASVFIPQVEDLVYNYLGIPRKKAAEPETTEIKPEDLLPTDLEAVSPGSVKSNDDKIEETETDEKDKMEVDTQEVEENKQEIEVNNDVEMSEVAVKSNESESMDKCLIPLPSEEIKLENIPEPVNSPPKSTNAKVELDSIALPHEPNVSTDIPLPEETPTTDRESYFKPIQLNSEDSNSSSDSSLRRNMSPLTPIRNFNNENSCDAQQGFDTDSDVKSDMKTVPSSFRFTIENKHEKSTENADTNLEVTEKKEQTDLSYQFNNQVNINTFNTPMYDDSSNSNNLHIDYESDVNSKTNIELKPEVENSQESSIKEKKSEEKKTSHKSSHRSRDSSRHSSSKDKRSDSKHSTSRDSSRHDKKSSRDEKIKSSKEREKSKDRSEKKDNRDSSKHRSSYKSSSKDKDSKSHKGSSSSHRHSSKGSEDRKSASSSSKDKEKTSDTSRDKSKDKPRDSKFSSSRESRDKDRKSSSSSKKPEDKDKKKDKKDIDDHYSSSGRGNHSRRSTDRDSNDGSSSSKGSQNHTGSKSSDNKKDSKAGSSKSDNTSTSGESPSPSDKEHITKDNLKLSLCKPVVRVDNHLETPIATPPRLPFVPDVTLKKPKFAANLQEAKKLMKMRKFLDEEQKRMNQEAALLLEFQANVRPSLSQVYSSIPGPELEFACVSTQPVQDSAPYEVNVPAEDTEKAVEQNLSNLDTEENLEQKLVNLDTEEIMEQNLVIVEDSTEENNANIEMETIPDAAQISEIIGVNINNENFVIEEVVLEDMDNGVTAEVIHPDEQNIALEPEDKVENTYDENKPFSELMDEITEYSKASEIKTKTDVEEKTEQEIELTPETKDVESNMTETVISTNTDNKYFEVTIITEELSESEEVDFEPNEQNIDSNIEQDTTHDKEDNSTTLLEAKSTTLNNKTEPTEDIVPAIENIRLETESTPKPNELQYFAEHEKYNAELERLEFNSFLKNYIESLNTNKKMYIINCDTYEENIVKEVASTMGDFEIINYYKNGHLKLPKTNTNVIKEESLSNELTLPQSKEYEEKSPIFSPVKSECSFELCNSDYDSKLDDINKKSRQEVMEIILGSVLESSPSKIADTEYYLETKEMEDVDYNLHHQEKNETESIILDNTVGKDSLKRSIDEVESSENNNRSVLTPKKIRKSSDSDQISSTTEESEQSGNNKRVVIARSKYLGKARRVGLSRPKRTNVSNSPSSDKSVENYVQNTPTTPNGKLKSTPRSKVQRYDTSDLYKPKLHYLSRRHNVS